ncbi:MAG: SUMF1/EgtB/PvdO family nonheme iron enzyme [Candidatus Thiodiazotropha endolucinida]|nr:SUMF1/EgtB/PvdO family nonheme iron enzyme [Candidatus Thiodiazotropha taylori]MCW4311982.1 SUMF1/EgtB/PvdO family nonheme iron enzyme [Candidatus Thiodiazotropha taylori]
MSNCPNCSHPIQPDWKACPYCQTTLKIACPSCGKELQSDWKACPFCGSSVGGAAKHFDDKPGAGPIGYCYRSGKAIHAGDPHFKCTDCDQLFLETYRFEETPVCQQCAQEQGMAQALEQERTAKAEAEAIQAREAAARKAERQRHEEAARLAREAHERAAREAEASRHQALEKLGITDEHWVAIQGGRFLMGSPETEEGREDNERQNWVKVGDFEMMNTPVTWAMYLAYCEATSRELPVEPDWGRHNDHPVVNVSYWDAVDYAQWLSEQTGWLCRLPTEVEWEYSCRAGTTTPFWTGDTISTNQSNYDGHYAYGSGCKGEYKARTTPVDRYPANPWGLHDMHGNVFEFCVDVWDEFLYVVPWDEFYSNKESEDVSQDRSKYQLRVRRGGSWAYGPNAARSAARESTTPDLGFETLGFRLARIKL